MGERERIPEHILQPLPGENLAAPVDRTLEPLDVKVSPPEQEENRQVRLLIDEIRAHLKRMRTDPEAAIETPSSAIVNYPGLSHFSLRSRN